MKKYRTIPATIIVVIIGMSCLPLPAQAQQTASQPDWSAFQFLLGDWIGEGSGNPGQGSGQFTFSLDLQNHVLIRRNQADYPETSERPAFSHRDMMVIYQEPGKAARAIYFDNEGHTIRYTTDVPGTGKSVTFISDSTANGPRFKLSYSSLASDSVLITFDIAPPGTDRFVRYLEGKAVRTNVQSKKEVEQK